MKRKINLKEDKTEVDRDIEKMLEDPETRKIYEKMAPVWEKEFDGMAKLGVMKYKEFECDVYYLHDNGDGMWGASFQPDEHHMYLLQGKNIRKLYRDFKRAVREYKGI